MYMFLPKIILDYKNYIEFISSVIRATSLRYKIYLYGIKRNYNLYHIILLRVLFRYSD